MDRVEEMIKILREEIAFLERQKANHTYGSATYNAYYERVRALRNKLAEIEKPAEIIIPAIYRDALVVSVTRSHRFLIEMIKSVEDYLAESKNTFIPLAQLADAAANIADWKKEVASYEAIMKILGG